MSTCPPADTLSRFLLDALGGDERSAVEAHVERCGRCQEALQRLSDLADGPTADQMQRWGLGAAAVGLPANADEFLQELSTITLAAGAAAERAAVSTTGDDWPQVDGYAIEDELGRGGMGVVYRARHLALRRLVALKMVLTGPVLAPQARQRLQQEARAVGRLHHPNIVQVYDVGEQAGRPFLAMELVEGGSLARRLGGRPLPPPAGARLVETVARAIHYAHTCGVVHRDLKPANILLADGSNKPEGIDGTDPSPIPKITDFGLAKDLIADAPGLTQSGAMLGTPGYMAPEQARGSGESVGPPADVYALGAILYELLTGRPPFKAATALDTLVQVVHSDPVPVARLQPAVPRDLAALCQKCLEKRPVDRYPTADALADDLRRFLAGEPTVARPVGPLGRVRRWGRRNPALAGVLAAVAVAGLATAALGAVWWQWQDAVEARTRADGLAVSEAAARAAAQDARGRAERAAVDLLLDRSLGLCEVGETTAGLLTLARALDQAVATGTDDQEAVLRANIAAWTGRSLTPREGPAQGSCLTCVAFTADGRLLTARWGNQWNRPGPGEARLWEITGDHGTPPTASAVDLRPAGPPLHDPDSIEALACTPDGGRAVTCSSAGSVRVWNPNTGAAIDGPLTDAGKATAVAIGPDGRRLVTGGFTAAGRWETLVWEFTANPGGEAGAVGAPPASRPGFAVRLRLSQPGRVNAVAFSPDGTTIVTGCSATDDVWSAAGGEARLWDAATGKPRGRPLAHPQAVTAVAISPDGRTLLTGCADRVARLWNCDTGRPIGTPWPHPFPVETAAFCPDGKTVVTGGGWQPSAEEAAGARVWDITTGKPLAGAMTFHAVRAVAVSPDGRLATASRDGIPRVYELAGLRPLLDQRQPGTIAAIAFSPDGRRLLTGGGVMPGAAGSPRGSARLTDLAAGSPGPLMNHDAPLAAVAFDSAGRTVITADRDGRIYSWDALSGQSARPPIGGGGRLIAFTPDLRAAAVLAADGRIGIWNVATGGTAGPPLSTPADPAGPDGPGEPPTAALDPAGRMLALCRPPGPVRLWDIITGRPVGVPLAHTEPVTMIAFGPDGRTVLTGDEGGHVRAWEAAAGRPLGPPMPFGRIPWQAMFSLDGRRFLTLADRTEGEWTQVRVWDAATITPLGPPLHQRVARPAAALHPAGRLIAAGSQDGTVRLWDGPTGRPVGPPLYHTAAVRALAFDPAGRRLAVGAVDGTVRVWPVPDPVAAPPADVRRWLEELTGYELDPAGGVRSTAATDDRRTRQWLGAKKTAGPRAGL